MILLSITTFKLGNFYSKSGIHLEIYLLKLMYFFVMKYILENTATK